MATHVEAGRQWGTRAPAGSALANPAPKAASGQSRPALLGASTEPQYQALLLDFCPGHLGL